MFSIYLIWIFWQLCSYELGSGHPLNDGYIMYAVQISKNSADAFIVHHLSIQVYLIQTDGPGGLENTEVNILVRKVFQNLT